VVMALVILREPLFGRLMRSAGGRFASK